MPCEVTPIDMIYHTFLPRAFTLEIKVEKRIKSTYLPDKIQDVFKLCKYLNFLNKKQNSSFFKTYLTQMTNLISLKVNYQNKYTKYLRNA
jgi:hypothetical protein